MAKKNFEVIIKKSTAGNNRICPSGADGKNISICAEYQQPGLTEYYQQTNK